ncbi:hypothetical protein Q4F19_15640 [Sphingomonas sp. BIUV-7]|uniref:Response regulator n=2 Tax=Sphingomonas natans TaxID=3063330 RepID=A0ABT8YBX8_9SPHN|nr:hypothetical protein [Sphingomonas sp. BIUV-7]
MFPGKVLLLSGQDSFNAAYIRRSLEFCGVSLVTATGVPEELATLVPEEDLASIVGCVAVDLTPEAGVALMAQTLPFPVLFVGGQAAPSLPGPYAWMHAPFASYQVIDRLMTLCRRGTP